MSQKITYLLGAGASAEALPVYSNFKERFSLFNRLVQNINPHQVEAFDGKFTLVNLQIDCNSLRSQLDHHSTPDIVAKKYFLQKEDEKLERLKAVLVVYFFYEQTCKNRPYIKDKKIQKEAKSIVDLRYDSFISQLLKPLKGQLEFRNNINILTWNYDFQFEMCCKNFTNKAIDNQDGLFISQPSPFHILPTSTNPDSFKILHLNGVAIASNKEPQEARIIDVLSSSFSYDDYQVSYLVQLYKYLIADTENLMIHPVHHLFFGWEMLDEYGYISNNWPIKKAVNQTCIETEILIIIGYSFPSFNEAIDSYLFKNFKNLHSIFIQDSNFSNVKGILESSYIPQLPKENPYKIKLADVGFTNQFFIPRSEIKGEKRDFNHSFIK